MRQTLATKPLTTAIRYGPAFFGHWKYFTSLPQGAKQAGSAPGPATTCGPAAIAALDSKPNANAAPAATRLFINITFPPCFPWRRAGSARASPLGSSRESRLGHAADPDIQREQAAGMRLLLEIGGVEIPDRRCDIERLQIRPTEHAARRLLHRQIDDAIKTAVRRIARQAPTVPLRIP